MGNKTFMIGSSQEAGYRTTERRLVVNALSNLVRYVFFVVVALFLTPYIVRTLGDSDYGVWVVISALIGYASILEVGIQPAVVKLVAEYRSNGESPELRGLVVTAFSFLGAMGVVGAVASLLALPNLLGSVVTESAAAEFPVLLFVVLAVDVAVLLPSYLFAGVLYGLQLYHLKNLIDMVGLLVTALLIVGFLRDGHILALATIKMAVDLGVAFAEYALCRKVNRSFSLDLRFANYDSLRRLLRFGGMMFASSTMARVATNSLPVIIAYFLSPVMTAFFAVPTRLIDYAKQLVWALGTGFMPAFSELHSANDMLGLRDMYIRYTKYIVIVSLPAVALIVTIGSSFLSLWIGPEYGVQGRGVLHILGGTLAVSLIQPLIFRLFVGIGRPGVVFKVSTLSWTLTLVLSTALVTPFGIAGVACGVLAGEILSQLCFVKYAKAFLRIQIVRFVATSYLIPGLATTLFAATLLAFGNLFGTDSYARLLAVLMASVPFYIGVVYRLVLDSREREHVIDWLRESLRFARTTVTFESKEV